MRSALAVLLLALAAPAPELRHRFLATDGETSKLIYVDQFHPEKDWAVETPKGPRDLRLVDAKTIDTTGTPRFAVSATKGSLTGTPGLMAIRSTPRKLSSRNTPVASCACGNSRASCG